MIEPMAKRANGVAGRLPADVMEFFRKQGAKGGRIGGRLSWERLTPEQRSARAKRASQAAAAARRRKRRKSRKGAGA
jgi:hypothetical protein